MDKQQNQLLRSLAKRVFWPAHFLVLLLLFPFIASSTQYPAGDVAPHGNPDG